MNANDRERKYRDELTDRIVKRSIYIRSKGLIKYIEVTPAMITEKRAAILAWRERKAAPKTDRQLKYCKICGVEITSGVYCGGECRKAKACKDNYNMNKARKVLRERLCNECGKPFMPEYGNKRRGFCSDECGSRHAHRNTKHIRRERFKAAFRERIYKVQIYRRDGFRCQICKGKVNMKAKVPHPLSPTMDHIIPLADGGKHEPSNVRLAHFICNSLRGDRYSDGGDQLILFG